MRLLLPLCLVASVATGCQSMPPPPAEPEQGATGSPEGALAAVDEAEETLRRLVRGDEDERAPVDALKTQRDEEDGAPLAAPPRAGRDAPDRCTRACRALASLERATDRLCRLTDEDDPRCRDARTRLDAGRELVERTCDGCRTGPGR